MSRRRSRQPPYPSSRPAGEVLVDQAVADIHARTGWRDFLAWFTTQAVLHDLPPRPMDVLWEETTRTKVLRRKRTRAVIEPSTHVTGWVVRMQGHPLNATPAGALPADTYFVAPTGAIHPVRADGVAPLPLRTLPPTDRTTWTVPRPHGATLAENLEHVMARMLAVAMDAPST